MHKYGSVTQEQFSVDSLGNYLVQDDQLLEGCKPIEKKRKFKETEYINETETIDELLEVSEPAKKRKHKSKHKHKNVEQEASSSFEDNFDQCAPEQDKEVLNKSLALSKPLKSKHKSKKAEAISSHEIKSIKQEASRVFANDFN